MIAGIAASSAGVVQEIGLLALYNVAFGLPLLAIVVVITLRGERANRCLQNGGAWLQHRWPVVLASLLCSSAVCWLCWAAPAVSGNSAHQAASGDVLSRHSTPASGPAADLTDPLDARITRVVD